MVITEKAQSSAMIVTGQLQQTLDKPVAMSTDAEPASNRYTGTCI